MDSNGNIFKAGTLTPRSSLMSLYQSLCSSDFKDLSNVDEQDLDWIQKIHDRHLDYYREERRMHFGAFALVGLAFMILLGPALSFDEFFIPLAAAEGLLLMLLIPYVFVYRKYEEGVRKKMYQAVIIEDERLFKVESSKN